MEHQIQGGIRRKYCWMYEIKLYIFTHIFLLHFSIIKLLFIIKVLFQLYSTNKSSEEYMEFSTV